MFELFLCLPANTQIFGSYIAVMSGFLSLSFAGRTILSNRDASPLHPHFLGGVLGVTSWGANFLVRCWTKAPCRAPILDPIETGRTEQPAEAPPTLA